MDIASFVFGLSGIQSIFDTTCLIWRTIAQAADYGEDVAKAMNKLEMEFFRFESWWLALQNLASNPQSRVRQPLPSEATSLVQHLQLQVQHPIHNAASSVEKLLEELQEILTSNGALAIAQQQALNQPNASSVQALNLAADSRQSTTRSQVLTKELLKGTSWFKRIKHGATPWRTTDQERLSSIHNDFVYWNDSLYSILPQNVRESVLQQGIAGYLVDVPENGLRAGSDADAQNAVLVEYAKLGELRRTTKMSGSVKSASPAPQNLVKIEDKTQDIVDSMPDVVDASRPFSVLEYAEKSHPIPSQALVEWYPYPPAAAGPDAKRLAQERIARLSLLLKCRPSTLRSLNTKGYVDNTLGESFGLIYQFPQKASTSVEPVTLYHLLSRHIPDKNGLQQKVPSLPSLGTRYEIAARLASTLYTFMLSEWHHKRFNSTSVFFLCPKGASASTTTLDLQEPYVGGYAVSRPDAPSEDTFRGVSAAETDIYLHPELRHAQSSSCHHKFQREFEVYSFGILLAEIGWWNILPRIAVGSAIAGSVPADKLRTRLIEKCKTDLACWMGEEYRDITLRCLNAERVQDGGVGNDLNEFYWHVVYELVKFMPS